MRGGTDDFKRWGVALTVGASLCAPSSSHAEIKNPQVATDGLVYAAQAAADEFWNSHGLYPCKGTIWEYADTRRDIVARALGCDTYYTRRFIKDTRISLTLDMEIRREVLTQICMIAIHERGHNLGFTHEQGRLMGENPKPVGRCIEFAIKNTRYKKHGKR